MKILIIDDEFIILKSLSRKFKRLGYEVITCQTFYEAINQIKNYEFDLIICDYDGVQGEKILKEYKINNGNLNNFIFYSGNTIDAVKHDVKFICKGTNDLESFIKLWKT